MDGVYSTSTHRSDHKCVENVSKSEIGSSLEDLGIDKMSDSS
jgi:hypothetical protein